VPRSPITSTGFASFAARETCSSIARNDGASPIKALGGGGVAGAGAVAKDANN
jgi:hypothetical protein